MKQAEGVLTPPQLEIMEVVWSHLPSGVSVAQIWERIAKKRSIGRTTVLTTVQRLEARGWLEREPAPGVARFRTKTKREDVVGQATGELIDTFFDGSASALVSNLLGSGRLAAKELKQLRALLDASKNQKGVK